LYNFFCSAEFPAILLGTAKFPAVLLGTAKFLAPLERPKGAEHGIFLARWDLSLEG